MLKVHMCGPLYLCGPVHLYGHLYLCGAFRFRVALLHLYKAFYYHYGALSRP